MISQFFYDETICINVANIPNINMSALRVLKGQKLIILEI